MILWEYHSGSSPLHATMNDDVEFWEIEDAISLYLDLEGMTDEVEVIIEKL